MAAFGEDGTGGARREEGVGGDVDGVLRAEEVEEDADAVFARAEAMDDAGESAHGAVGDFNEIARLERGGDFFDDLAVHFGADGFDDFIGDLAEVAAEFDDIEDALGVANGAQGDGGVEAGEEVAGEEGFDEPDFASGGGALEFDARAVGGDAEHAFEHGSGDMFCLGAGMHHVPGEVAGGGGGVWGGFEQEDRWCVVGRGSRANAHECEGEKQKSPSPGRETGFGRGLREAYFLACCWGGTRKSLPV